ncbi:MAG: acyl-CoA carboxylase subunit beta [Candidatus Ancillula trichonymphae]|jgi:acetyl-CoA carboxylase carboxyltransferase component|nr:acyl-CoA carboxylase subunit beta [Candidatus Ancillula trichonymphae]
MGLLDKLLGRRKITTILTAAKRTSKVHKNIRRNRNLVFRRKQKVDFRSILSVKTNEIEALAIQKQRAKGKLSARQRIDLLLDSDTFVEIGQFVGGSLEDENFRGSAVITGFGNVHGQKVCVYAQDFCINGGSLGAVEGQKICNLLDLALDERVPVVAMLDSGGARIQEGVVALGNYGRIFRRTAQASGVIPQISLILGPCAGGAVYCPALTDFVIMTAQNSNMFVTGPGVVRAVTGEAVTADELGGARMHSEISGVSHHMADSDENAIEYARVLLSFLPASSQTTPTVYDYQPTSHDEKNAQYLESVLPESAKSTYDILDVIYSIVDYEEFLEVHQLFAPSAVVGFARIGGRTVGVIANQPAFNAGTLDIDASEKIARFMQFCDAFNISIVTLVDVPGYRPGIAQERSGIIRRGAKVITAYATTTVPLITVVLRKAYGGAYIVMGSKEIGADINLTWPNAQIAVLGAESAVQIVHKRRLKQANDNGEDVEKLRRELIDEYTREAINTRLSLKKGALDAEISPCDTRRYIIESLDLLKNKKVQTISRKHDNRPL